MHVGIYTTGIFFHEINTYVCQQFVGYCNFDLRDDGRKSSEWECVDEEQ